MFEENSVGPAERDQERRKNIVNKQKSAVDDQHKLAVDVYVLSLV